MPLPFDFIIGSSHLVHGQDPYYAAYYQGNIAAYGHRCPQWWSPHPIGDTILRYFRGDGDKKTYYQGKTERQAYEEYFLSILENVKTFDCFHVYGHLDYVIR